MERESPDCARSLVGQFEHPRAVECVARLERLPADTPCADRADYGNLKCRHLILGNRQDPIHPWPLAETLAQMIPGALLREVTPKSVRSRPARGRRPAGDRRLLDRPFSRFEVTDVEMFHVALVGRSANLAAEISRVEPYTERFHLDVADGHYVPSMLFFPDLVKALRKHTSKPFEVHLMTTDPCAWVEPFVEAGADGVIFCFDSLADPGAAIKRVKDAGQVCRDLAPGDRAGRPARAVLEHDRSGDHRRHADGDKGDLDGAVDLRQDPRGPGRDRETFGPTSRSRSTAASGATRFR